MVWGSFGITHIITLVISVLLIIGIYFILKNKEEKIQITVLGVLSFSGIAAIIYNLLTWDSPLEYLPFHLCSLNALMLPIAVFTKNKTLNNLLLLWALGALLALVINTAQADFEIFSWTFIFYYFPHTLELGIPVLMFVLKLAKLDVKCVLSTVVITFISYTIIHFINVSINAFCLENNILNSSGEIIKVNYMYSILPENPVLQLFYNMVPHSYWYMLIAIPVIIVYLSCIYSKQIINLFRKQNAVLK